MNTTLPFYFESILLLLPGKKEADIAGHSSRIFEDLGLQPKAEWSQVFTPEFEAELGSALQSLVPVRLRVVDPSAAIDAQCVWKAVDLNFALSALGGLVDQLHEELHQLVGRPGWGLVKFLHHRLLLFFLLLHVAQLFRSLCRLALGHPAPEISGGKTDRPPCLGCDALFGHD